MVASKSHIHTNHLLARLGPREAALLAPHLETVDLKLGQRLSAPGKPITHAYFPTSGMISLVHTFDDGGTIEVGLIGQEGFWGAPLVHQVGSSPIEAMVQGTGQALRISAKALLAVTDASSEIRNGLLRYAHTLQVQIAITAGCNGTHKVPQRVARWLLEAQDRLGGDDIELSHEFLSYMLGIRRAGVTAALTGLKTKGAIEPRRGKITIQNRKIVEQESCECYRIMKREYRRVFPKAAP